MGNKLLAQTTYWTVLWRRTVSITNITLKLTCKGWLTSNANVVPSKLSICLPWLHFCMHQQALFCLPICIWFTNGGRVKKNTHKKNTFSMRKLNTTTKTYIDLGWIQVSSWHDSRQMVCLKLSVTLSMSKNRTFSMCTYERHKQWLRWAEKKIIHTVFFVKDDKA